MSTNKKKELNELFRKNHPEISPNITLSKINSVKAHLLNIGKVMDLEMSSVSHAFVYFEKLVLKRVVNKQNRKLLAGKRRIWEKRGVYSINMCNQLAAYSWLPK